MDKEDRGEMILLDVQGLSKSYGDGDKAIPILNQVNFSLEAGHTLSIMGKSGSGKSTLLSLILGLEKIDFGDIYFLGQSLKQSTENEMLALRRSSIGVIFQNHQLIETLSAWENVWLAAILRNVANPENEAKVLLEQVELGHRLNHLPSELSGGENQRVAIARSLIGNPKLLLADEPNANLDSVTGEKVMELMLQLVAARKQTLILVTHDSDLANRCELKYTLDHRSMTQRFSA